MNAGVAAVLAAVIPALIDGYVRLRQQAEPEQAEPEVTAVKCKRCGSSITILQ